jgi:hypothetical protein
MTLSVMARKKKDSEVAPLSDDELHEAIRYFAQVALESRVDPIGYQGTHELLRRIAVDLAAHRALRVDLRRRALIAEIVDNVVESEQLAAKGVIATSEHWERVAKWLRRVGLSATAEQARTIFSAPPRYGARARTRKELVLDQLAAVAGTSQSDLEKLVAVSERGATTGGRLGNAQLQERAASDVLPSTKEAFLFVCEAFGIDDEDHVLSDADREHLADAHDQRVWNAATLEEGLARKQGRSPERK